MNEASTKRDLLENARASSVLWGLPIATIVLTGYFADGGWIVTISWTIALAVMGIACVVNARGLGACIGYSGRYRNARDHVG